MPAANIRPIKEVINNPVLLYGMVEGNHVLVRPVEINSLGQLVTDASGSSSSGTTDPELYASGTQTAVVTTEHFLSSPNEAGKFQLEVDKTNMAAGDVVELRAYKMVLTGGTSRVVYIQTYYGAQPTDDLISLSPVIPNDLAEANAVRFSLTQTFGTGRAFPWKVLKV